VDLSAVIDAWVTDGLGMGGLIGDFCGCWGRGVWMMVIMAWRQEIVIKWDDVKSTCYTGGLIWCEEWGTLRGCGNLRDGMIYGVRTFMGAVSKLKLGPGPGSMIWVAQSTGRWEATRDPIVRRIVIEGLVLMQVPERGKYIRK
jgi:hypothetical protein